MTDRQYWRSIMQERWVDPPSWLPPGEALSDSLADLRTKKNSLSVYVIPEGADAGTAGRIGVAMAAIRQSVDAIEYVLLDGTKLEAIGVKVEAAAGVTPDPDVNTLHRNLVELTAAQVSRLAALIRESAPNFGRALPDDLRKAVAEQMKTGKWKLASVHRAVKDDLKSLDLI